MSKADLLALAKRIAESDGRATMLPVIEKELLHYEILLALDNARLLERLTFQGGTCLRLCFGSPRYSEDLDFVGGPDFQKTDIIGIKDAIEDTLLRRYDLEVTVVEPARETQRTPDTIAVDRWQIKVVTAPDRPDIPQQRISLEVAAVSAHTRETRALELNYRELPSSYGDILVRTETLEEICADKLKAFVTAPYLRYRDLWDLRWIARQPSFSTESLPWLLKQKVIDYHQESTFQQNYGRMQDVSSIIESPEFFAQMRRFLPAAQLERTVERLLFREHMATEVLDLYRAAGIDTSLSS